MLEYQFGQYTAHVTTVTPSDKNLDRSRHWIVYVRHDGVDKELASGWARGSVFACLTAEQVMRCDYRGDL
jgi:hypothetical protein